MPNTIEELLSETADFFQKRLAGDPELVTHLRLLCEQDLRPHLMRPLTVDVPGYAVSIAVFPEME